jgi:hypothetical protein
LLDVDGMGHGRGHKAVMTVTMSDEPADQSEATTLVGVHQNRV